MGSDAAQAPVRIEPVTVAQLERLLEGDAAFTQSYGIPVAERWIEFPEALPPTLQALRERAQVEPWWAYLVFERATGTLVGMCGFKGPPDLDGAVEIGYGIAPDRRGRGYATAAARALLRIAFDDPRVRLVRAHTLPVRNASNRLLARLGFRFLGPVEDPEDGTVWRWELPHAAMSPREQTG